MVDAEHDQSGLPPERPPEDEARLVLSHREEAKWLAYILFVLAAVTALVGGSNWLRLERARVLTSEFQIRTHSTLTSPVEYLVEIEWLRLPSPLAGDAKPTFLLAGEPLSRSGRITIPAAAGPVWRQFGIEVGVGVAPGRYEALLRFVPGPDTGEEDLIPFSFPITVEVPTFWGEWYLLVVWLVVAGSLLAITYLLMLWIHPAPRGSITVRYLDDDYQLGRGDLRLRAFLGGLLSPLSRSTVAVEKVIGKQRWGRRFRRKLPLVTLEFARFGLFQVMVCVLVREGQEQVRRLELMREPTRKLVARDGLDPGVYFPLMGTGPHPWYVMWRQEGGAEASFWVAFMYNK